MEPVREENGAVRRRVLLSEASSLTSREFVTVLGRSGTDVGVLSWSALPISRFSRWCRQRHPVPSPSSDPVGYLQAADEVMRSGDYDAMLPTHEQAWLFAAGSRYLSTARPPVADVDSFDRVQSKLAFAQTLDELELPQPEWRRVRSEDELGALGFPVWVKAAFSTAGRGVRSADGLDAARAAWREFSKSGEVMIQRSAAGVYAQVQGVFWHGRLIGAAVSEQLATGVGGSAAARVSVDHPNAVAALTALGAHLAWHGGLDLDYFHVGGDPQFIECNPRTVEPGNAYFAGVNLPQLLVDVSLGEPTPGEPLVARAGIRTRSTMAIALGAAERVGTRRAVLASVVRAVAQTRPLGRATEVLTPVIRDPESAVPLLSGVGSVGMSPNRVANLAAGTVSEYGITAAAIDAVRPARS